MSKIKILYICTEVLPYTIENEIAKSVFETAKELNNSGAQLRVFLPRYGTVNDRRHQLHEVIRLSGMNLIVNDVDMPLIIKVASIPKERIQVYFIENDDYFRRNDITLDENGNLFQDNDERAIFFAKGVIETVKKLSWSPDIIHIQGWLAWLVPLYLKTFYKYESIFSDSKIITSVYDDHFEGMLGKDIQNKLLTDNITKEDVPSLSRFSHENLLKTALEYSHGLVFRGDTSNKKWIDYAKKLKKKTLITNSIEEFPKELMDFYNAL